MKKKTTEEFIEDAKKIHGNRYDYSLVDYKNSHTKVKIICPIHGVYEQVPYTHMNAGGGCNKCAIEFKARNLSLTKEQFINKSNQIHNNKYDYSLSEYKNNSTKIKIICPIHGIFEQKPMSHLAGNGCSTCGGTKKLTTKEFIEKAEIVHGNRYDYSLVEYINASKKVKIICKEHGVFKQNLIKHVSAKQGCPKCRKSKGENQIKLFLESNDIGYIGEKTFEECKNILKLPFDFYLPNYNICIEFDGEQHFKPRERFGGIESFNEQKLRDKIKTEYCIKNNIKLIRIKYTDDIIEILKTELCLN